MYRSKEYYKGGLQCSFARYHDVEDLVRAVGTSKKAAAYRSHISSKWAGGTYEMFEEGARGSRNKYTARAERMMDKFTNVALEPYGIDFDYNEDHGALDWAAYEAGEDQCLFGPTHVETDKAPIKVYVDQWISSTISPEAIQNRGVAVMALVQALSMFRPVTLDVVLANRHSNAGVDVIQVCPAPTSPMNTSLTAWMLAAPEFVRMGYMGMTYELADTSKNDGIPLLSAGLTWQNTQLGKWLAARDGVEQFVFLPLMYDNRGWGSEEYALAWVQSEMKRLLGDAWAA